MTVVLRAVCVTVTEVVVGICRQEHANSMSEDERERMLENMLAASVGGACLLRMGVETVVLTASAAVLFFKISI
jgi:nicotinamide mononucleotide adenylyltransferase